MPNVFVSYSRQDFHVAEALTATLAAHGTVPWLDVERIRPGADWPAAINAAIDAADVVVVVTSPAALASPYVREEWRRALAVGKPVRLALVRGTTLPPELSAVPVNDLRGRFFPHARQLAKDIVIGWRQSRRAFPLSPALATLWLALLYCAFAAGRAVPLGLRLHQTASDPRAAAVGLAVLLMNAVLLAALGHLVVGLARRSATPAPLRVVFGSMLLVVVFDWVAAALRREPAWWYLGAVVAAVLGSALVRFSRTIHLVTPTGAGRERLRARATGKPRPRGRNYARKLAELRELLPGAGIAATYAVLHTPQDQPIATLIVNTCDRAGFAQDNTDPGWVFFVVSSRTTRSMMDRVLAVFGDRVVFVLATSLRLPDDALARQQWLDFRDQGAEGLYEFLRAAVTSGWAHRGVVATPVGVDRFAAPRYVGLFLAYAQFLLAYTATVPIGMLLAGSFPVALLLVTVALDVVLVQVMIRTATRRITAVGWFCSVVLAYGLFVAWLVLAPAPNFVLVARIVVGVVALVSLFRPLGPLLRYWLPPEPEKLLSKNVIAPPVHVLSSPVPALVMAPGFMALLVLTGS